MVQARRENILFLLLALGIHGGHIGFALCFDAFHVGGNFLQLVVSLSDHVIKFLRVGGALGWG